MAVRFRLGRPGSRTPRAPLPKPLQQLWGGDSGSGILDPWKPAFHRIDDTCPVVFRPSCYVMRRDTSRESDFDSIFLHIRHLCQDLAKTRLEPTRSAPRPSLQYSTCASTSWFLLQSRFHRAPHCVISNPPGVSVPRSEHSLSQWACTFGSQPPQAQERRQEN